MFLRLLAWFVLLPVLGLAGEWEVIDAGGKFSGEPIQYVRKTVKQKGDSSLFSVKALHLALFDSRKFSIRVVDNGSAEKPAFAEISTAMQKNSCAAGVNGGFFLESYAPSGLQIADGKRTGKFGTAKLLSGVIFTDHKGIPRLLRRGEFRDNLAVQQLIQAGPFLVDQGKTVTGLSESSPRRRSFILTDGKTKWAIGMTDSLTLAQLGEVLALDKLFPEINVHRALNLDGGSSSGFYYDKKSGSRDVHLRSIKRVRNFLGVTPR